MDRSERVQRLFAAALELAPEQREGFLTRECGDDAELRAELLSLLEHEAAPGLPKGMDTPSGRGPVRGLLEQMSADPEQIGSYRIVRRLGSGGMGVVYEALQESPRRRVAIKVPRPGLLSGADARRLEREIETLARLRHPGIAAIFEAGTYESPWGQHPYYVMELVEGVSITRFVAERRRTIPEIAALMEQVAAAVYHAHQQGVVHRDLKPANILVDAEGQPRVLDFGISRVLVDVEAQRQTRSGEVLGTLAYMSPEQIRRGSQSVDERTDVYALGLILDELLRGHPTFDLKGKTPFEQMEILVGQEPPSLRAARPEVDEELAAIVEKARRKEAGARYAGAEELRARLAEWRERVEAAGEAEGVVGGGGEGATRGEGAGGASSGGDAGRGGVSRRALFGSLVPAVAAGWALGRWAGGGGEGAGHGGESGTGADQAEAGQASEAEGAGKESRPATASPGPVASGELRYGLFPPPPADLPGPAERDEISLDDLVGRAPLAPLPNGVGVTSRNAGEVHEDQRDYRPTGPNADHLELYERALPYWDGSWPWRVRRIATAGNYTCATEVIEAPKGQQVWTPGSFPPVGGSSIWVPRGRKVSLYRGFTGETPLLRIEATQWEPAMVNLDLVWRSLNIPRTRALLFGRRVTPQELLDSKVFPLIIGPGDSERLSTLWDESDVGTEQNSEKLPNNVEAPRVPFRSLRYE